MSFTAIFQKVPEGYIGFVEELPLSKKLERTLMKLFNLSSKQIASLLKKRLLGRM